MTINLLNDLTKLNIKEFEFDDLKNMENSTGYDFPTIKLKVFLSDDKIDTKDILIQKDLYIKMIRKDRIKESIFCYWNLLYDQMFKNYEESEFTSVINKVSIKETENEEYKHTVLLEIKENKWNVLECGSTVHLVKFAKYLNNENVKKSKLTKQWKNYLEEDNQDVLFIGLVN